MTMTKMVQIVWLIIAAVCVVEAYVIFASSEEDKTSGWLFSAVALVAIFRYVVLKRMQLRKENKID